MERLARGFLASLLITGLVSACSSSSDAEAGPGETADSDGGDGTGEDAATETPLPPSASDGVKNGSETDVDCGGDASAAARCADGKTCAVDADCKNAFCHAGVCATPTGSDHVKNGDESDVDCGGTTTGAAKCADGKACKDGVRDCASAVCKANVCVAPTHSDGVENGDETGEDCGGPTAGKCGDGEGCTDGARDCTSSVCKSDVCQAPTHGDGVKNGDETGKDCGGPTSGTPCDDLDGCLDAVNAARDCKSGVCKNNVCQKPTDSDTVQNGLETDVDCGGDGDAKRCAATKKCQKGSDCSSLGCNDATKTCAWGRSCTQHHGGDTCGVGDETFPAGTPGAVSFHSTQKDHHDCCESARVDPDGVAGNADDFQLDKYQITAGRMRVFLDAVGGNVRKWVQDARNGQNGQSFRDPGASAQLPATNDTYLPVGYTSNETAPTTTPVSGDFQKLQDISSVNVLAHMSGYRYTTEPGGNFGYGCTIQPNAYGARTWRLDDAQLGQEVQHSVAKDRLDEKALTCVDYFMLAAFCAWDGGRLETKAEHDLAWKYSNPYPWGAGGPTQGFYYAIGDLLSTGNKDNPAFADLIFNATPVAPGNFIQANLDRTNAAWNYSNYIIRDGRRYLETTRAQVTFPGESDKMDSTSDQTYAVAPPGRYPAGNGPFGHADLLGNVIEITAERSGTAYKWTKNGSFEGYVHFSGNVGYDGFAFSGLTKYGRSGGRCGRPLNP